MKDCCTDSEGTPKKKYSSKEEAEKIAQFRRDEGLVIKVYQCEMRNGWHLTSLNATPPARSKNVLTSEDSRLYTEKIRKRLKNVLGEAKSNEIRDKFRRIALEELQAKVDQLERDSEEQLGAVQNCRKEMAILRGDLKAAEQELRESRQNLSKARHELEVASRQIR